jgi:hypothetical protein
MRGWCQGAGYRVGFGEVEGTILRRIVMTAASAFAQAGTFLIRAECAAMSSRLYDRCTRLSRAGASLPTIQDAIPLRPDRPRHKAAAAVRADIVELVLDAIGAERALIAANPRVGGFGGRSLSQYSQFGRSCSAIG